MSSKKHNKKHSGFKIPEKKAGMDEINITPLIDVVLVLLIIFMVLTPITVQTMASRLPPTDTEDTPPPPPDQVPDQLMIAVYDDNTLALNLQVLDDATMQKELCDRLPRRAKKTVFIDAHKNANYARVITIMDVARDCGAETVGFAEITDEGPARLAPGQPLPGAPTDPAAPPATP